MKKTEENIQEKSEMEEKFCEAKKKTLSVQLRKSSCNMIPDTCLLPVLLTYDFLN